jgi:hypothetical protein
VILEKYLNGYYNQGFNSISSLLADSVTIKDAPDYMITYSKDEYKVIYEWDSTFLPENKYTIIGQTDTTIDFFEERYSIRFEFLEHNPLKMKQRIHFRHGQISTIENMEYLNFNVDKWTSNRDSLVSWIDRNHPELTGFIFDLTPKGAENYMKAIELYKKAQ